MKAYLFESLEDRKVRCHLCHHRCIVKQGKRGICGVRENKNGQLETLVFGNLIAKNVDPIEKKPLFHFYPGTLSYSIATVGCNLKCLFCQNADIAQMPADKNGMIVGSFVSPEEIVAAAVLKKCKSISYTYTEPTVYFELAYETAKLAHEKGLKNIFVTNGYMTREALDMISPYLDAANVDLKAFNNEFYKRYCKAKLSHVKETLVLMKELGIFIEITTLLIPDGNDDMEELKQLAHFITHELGAEIPWHISRFHPTYKLVDRLPTPVDSILDAREIGIQAGLKYVYVGNVYGQTGENTYCHFCGELLVERQGFQINQYRIKNSSCPICKTSVSGVGL